MFNNINIPYVTDEFLDEFKTNFDNKYMQYYKNKDTEAIRALFEDNNVLLKSKNTFVYEPLIIDETNPTETVENIKILRESLKSLSPVEAENEKIWVALCNTYYLEYHLSQLDLIGRGDINKSIKGRTIFTQGRKRSLMMNNLAHLWWIGHYTYDELAEDPYYYTDYFVRGSYKGNALTYLSSNIVSNKEVVIGTLQALEKLENEGVIERNRYAFTNSNKILNQIGGVRVVDSLSRGEVKEIILNHILETDKIKILV